MRNKFTFAHLGYRWGGQVTILPRFSISRNFMTSILLLSLMLFILFPAIAQDATPTADIPVIVTDGSTIDTTIVIAGMAVFAIISLGSTALVAYLVKLLGNSVKTEQIQGVVDSLQKWMYNQAVLAAGRTPQQWDDNIVPAVANWFGYNPAVGTPVRPPTPPTVPPAPQPIPSRPALLPKGIPINRNSTLNEFGSNGLAYIEVDRDGRKIATPHGFAYRGEPGAVDGKASAHCEVYYKPGGGFEFALADKAGWFGYEFSIANFVLAGKQRFAVVCEYVANYSPVIGPDNIPTVYLGGSLKSAGRVLAQLANQPIVAAGKAEAQWVFSTEVEYPTLDGAMGVYMPYGSVDDTGTLLIKRIAVVPVADTYGDDHPEMIIRI